MSDKKSKITKPKKVSHFYIDLGVALEDDLIIGKEFVEYLKTNLKVNGKKGNIGDQVTIALDKKRVDLSGCHQRQKWIAEKIPEIPHQKVPQEKRHSGVFETRGHW